MDDDLKAIEAAASRLADRNVRLREFLLRLTDAEDLGWAVSPEVRKLALMLATNQDTNTLPTL